MLIYKKYLKLKFVIQLKGAIVEQEVKGQYILYMTNMYHPLFFMTFYDLGLDNVFLVDHFLYGFIITAARIERTCSWGLSPSTKLFVPNMIET